MTPTTFTYRFRPILKKNGPTTGAALNQFPPAHRRQSDDRGRHGMWPRWRASSATASPPTTLDIYTYAFDKNKRPPARGCKGCWRYDIA